MIQAWNYVIEQTNWNRTMPDSQSVIKLEDCF
jgi:hypothetical protein